MLREGTGWGNGSGITVVRHLVLDIELGRNGLVLGRESLIYGSMRRKISERHDFRSVDATSKSLCLKKDQKNSQCLGRDRWNMYMRRA
jgi:hypothetical protein